MQHRQQISDQKRLQQHYRDQQQRLSQREEVLKHLNPPY